MKFDVSLFYSDSLPYPDVTGTGLNGYAELPCQESNPDPSYHTCDPWIPLRLSDDPLNYFYSVTDSVVFIGYNNSVHTPDNGGIYLPLMIKPYAPPLSIQRNTASSDYIKVSPNPFVDKINIDIKKLENFSYSIYSIDGREVKTTHSCSNNLIIISTNDLPAGLYYLIIESENVKSVKKIIKV